jgi:hypothetical protein
MRFTPACISVSAMRSATFSTFMVADPSSMLRQGYDAHSPMV